MSYVSLPPSRPDPHSLKPTTVQWYRDFMPINESEENQITDGFNRYLIPLQHTQIVDNQLYLIKVEPSTEAFSLEPHEKIFFFGGKFIPLHELEDRIDQDLLQRLIAYDFYAKLITNLGNTFWLQRDKHWYLDLNANGELQIPGTDTRIAYQEVEVICHLHELITSDHLTLNQAIKKLSLCPHEIDEETLTPWLEAVNYNCDKCGLGFSIDINDPCPDFSEVYSAWPGVVERISHDFAGLIFGGLKDLPLYNFRHIVMAEIEVHTPRGTKTEKIAAWLKRDGAPIIY